MLESQAHLDPRFKNFPNLPEDEYESILAVPILTRDGTLEGALNVRTREPRAFSDDEVELLLAIAAQVAHVDRAREALHGGAAARARARGARAHLGGGAGLAVPRGVARGDRQDDDGCARRDGRRARSRRRPHRVAGGRRVHARDASVAHAGAAGRSASWSPTARRRSPMPTASCSRRSRRTLRSRWSMGGQ